ncbi:MAG: hypothetical protein GTO14_24730 [Anaerolineales bacterium]|nr:hypothetical protein [Anaerolineales bacterium]
MTERGLKSTAKSLLGNIPFAVELWQSIRPASGEIPGGYRLDKLEAVLPSWVGAASATRTIVKPKRSKRILIVCALSWWVEYGTALGLWLSSQGHDVEMAFLPYRRWTEDVRRFDVRRQRSYLKNVLAPTKPLFRIHDLLGLSPSDLPSDLIRSIEAQSRIDVQYTMRRETISVENDGQDHKLYGLRLARNLTFSRTLYALMQERPFDLMILPNGSILEFGAAYRLARFLDVPVVTYEFGEQRGRIWLAQNDEVMLQDTSKLWRARGHVELTEDEVSALTELRQARRGGKLWSNFTRQWQTQESKGANAAREALGLDGNRPITLLCTNVVGDSLSLGRQLFTDGMADWLMKTVSFFADRPETQLVVRVHPGELRGVGHPSEEIVQAALPEMPDHVIVVPPDAKVNTYDLIEITHLGLVYTTTVGLEMTMSGIPVVVAGRTHYREKGFTHDPDSFDEYFSMIDMLLARPFGEGLSLEEMALAERYAYRFFFEYALPFPWHLRYFWEDINSHPLEDCLEPEGQMRYERTLAALSGDPVVWGAN